MQHFLLFLFLSCSLWSCEGDQTLPPIKDSVSFFDTTSNLDLVSQKDGRDIQTDKDSWGNTQQDMVEDLNESSDMEKDVKMDTVPDPKDPLLSDMRTFIFGHSLIVHATNSDETTVPHWMHQFAKEAGYKYAVDGQYGFLRNHANLPPTPQWGFQQVQGVWDSDQISFAEANFNTILLTAGNFIQYQSASIPYDGDNPNNETPIGATRQIIEWVEKQEPGIRVYIYENWPDMGGFIADFPATPTEFKAYNTYTRGGFHQWWIDYHDLVLASHPNVKMIPVGPILSHLFETTDLKQIPISDLYSDSAPHGKSTLYFLASLITYAAMYGIKPPVTYSVPESVHPLVKANFQTTIDTIWTELNNFKDDSGESRVF